MSDAPTTKVCTKCGVEKGLGEFSRHVGYRSGLHNYCRPCVAAWRRNKYASDADFRAKAIKNSEAQNKKRFARPAQMMLRGAKERAKENGVPFNLREEEISIPTHCPVIGMPLVKQRGRASNSSPSLDRKIPVRGYVNGNVAVISHRANTLKRDATPVESAKIALYQAECQANYIKHLESELERLKKAQ